MQITYKVTRGLMGLNGFEADRRRGQSNLTILHSMHEEVQLTIHVKSDELLKQIEDGTNIGPWGDGDSTVPNMRGYQGSLEDFLKELEKVGEIVEIK